jgi:hypothetical protein
MQLLAVPAWFFYLALLVYSVRPVSVAFAIAGIVGFFFWVAFWMPHAGDVDVADGLPRATVRRRR